MLQGLRLIVQRSAIRRRKWLIDCNITFRVVWLACAPSSFNLRLHAKLLWDQHVTAFARRVASLYPPRLTLSSLSTSQPRASLGVRSPATPQRHQDTSYFPLFFLRRHDTLVVFFTITIPQSWLGATAISLDTHWPPIILLQCLSSSQQSVSSSRLWKTSSPAIRHTSRQ